MTGGWERREALRRDNPGAQRVLATADRVTPLDQLAMAQARDRQDQLTKPPGSLGRLERLAVQIAGITGRSRPRLEQRAVVVMAADHGVADEGVSAYPSAVTAQMVHTFARGGAAINVLARQARARVVVVDVGVSGDLPADLPIRHRKVARGSANLVTGPALSRDQALAAIAIGLDIVEEEIDRGLDVVCLGEMGIGNTTAASALVAAVTGAPVAVVTGRGTGVDEPTWRHKVSVIEASLARQALDPADPLGLLASLGGLDIAGLVGVALGAAARGRPVVLDGFIATAAALVAAEVCPTLRGYLIAAHRSVEPGHRVALERLELEPLVALDLRLGEGTGAALVLPILDAALAVLDEMATFAEAGVSGPAESGERDSGGSVDVARRWC